MKLFHLDMRAYHMLERVHYVNITESGHSVTRLDPRVRYLIILDEKANRWIYYRFSNKRDDLREFIIASNKPARCRVFANFDQVSKYN